jgi:hypothetical protein
MWQNCAECQHEQVVAEGAFTANLGAVRPVQRCQRERALCAVQGGDLAGFVAIVVALAVRGVVQAVVDLRAGGDLVQLRLPDMGGAAFDQHHLGAAGAADGAAQPADQFQPAGAAANHHDAWRAGRCREGV